MQFKAFNSGNLKTKELTKSINKKKILKTEGQERQNSMKNYIQVLKNEITFFVEITIG